MLKILYDPKYNFHIGYHSEIIKSTSKDILWIKGHLVNKYEFCIRSKDPSVRKKFISLGYFKERSFDGVIFSPRVFLLNKNPYFLEIEDIWWFFGDTYEEVYSSCLIPKWKVKELEQHFCRKNLIHVFWWSRAAIERFKVFCKINSVSPFVIDHVLRISSVLYPSSPTNDSRVRQKREKKEIISVFDKNNFYRKGGDVILEIFGRLFKSGINNYFLKIFGSYPSCFRRVIQNTPNISFLPITSRNKFQKALSLADIFIFSSRADTFGTVLIDAINNGCFVVSTYGKTVFATREILQKYPNKIIIKNLYRNEVYGEIDKERFYKVIRFLLLKDVKYRKWKSPFNRDELKKNFLKIILSKSRI